MLFFRKFLMYISAVFLFVFCVFSVLLTANIDTNKWVRDLLDNVFALVFKDLTVRIIVLTIATILLIFCLGVVFSAIKFGRRDKTYKVESPYGEVRVSIGAIEDYLNMVKAEVRGVKDMRPKVFLRKGKIKMYVRITLWADSDIGDIVVNVQNAIRSYLTNIMAEEKIGDIRVFVGKIMFREKTESRTGKIRY